MAGDGYDGGHLHQNAHAGGAERINIVVMVDTGRNVEIDLYIDYPEDSDSRTPTAITAEYRVDGRDPIREEFENVRDD